MLAWFRHEFHANLCLALEQFGGNVVSLVFEFGDTVFACVVYGLHELVVDKDVELVGLPFAHTPVFELELEVGLSARLHEVAEEVSVACVTPEHVVGVSCVGAVGLHLMVCLRLLLARLHLVDRALLHQLALFLRLGQVVEIVFVFFLREREPVHHVSGVVNLEERHNLVAYRVLHPC